MKERKTEHTSIDFEQEPEGLDQANSVADIMNKLKSDFPEVFSINNPDEEIEEIDQLIDEDIR